MRMVVYSCCHADPRHGNDRADVLGDLLYDFRPDVVIDLGDSADLNSLCSHETRGAEPSTTYGDDIEAHLDFQSRLRARFNRQHRRKPHWVWIEGNHENRIARALNNDPRLLGAISYNHLKLDKFFDEVFYYRNNAPYVLKRDNMVFSHFLTSGNYGTPMSSIHHGYNLVKKTGRSTFVGHTHKRSHYMDEGMSGSPQGVVVGCFKGHEETWAGQANNDWWHGVVLLHGACAGRFDLEWYSLKRMENGK